MTKISNVNKSTRTLNTWQFGWICHALNLEFTTRSLLCGSGQLFWKGWAIGEAQQLEGGDWRVTLEGVTENRRQLMDQFTQLRTY